MSASSISYQYAEELIKIYNQCLKEGLTVNGIPGVLAETGRRLNPPKHLGTQNLDRIRELYGLVPDNYAGPEVSIKSEGIAKVSNSKPSIIVKPTYRISAGSEDAGAKTLICGIGDLHDGPRIPDKSRLILAGKHVATRKHDAVVQIGDFLTIDSVSRFAAPGTLEGKQAPFWKEDMASGKEAFSAFDEGLNGYNVKKHCTLGNHEDRYHKHLERQPWALDALEDTPHSLLEDFGWEYSPYGAFHFIGKTGFTHVPLNRMGKPFGGKFAENQIGNDSTFDVVYGHSHRPLVKPFPKLNNIIIKVVNLGCFLPDKHVEPYAKHTLHGWEWGLCDITLLGGCISSVDWIPMTELEERYG